MLATALSLMLLCAPLKVLTLADALSTAARGQPHVRQMRARTVSARARADEARAPLLPAVAASVSYSRQTGNYVPGSTSGSNLKLSPSGASFDYWNAGIGISQTLWDGTGKLSAWLAAREVAAAQSEVEHASWLDVAKNVRDQFLVAHTNRALVEVARDNLARLEKHLAQIGGYVKIGTRPGIDLAHAKSDRAYGEYQLISAVSTYEASKAQLNRAIGIEGPIDYDVSDEAVAPVHNEEAPLAALLDEAYRARPELKGARRIVAAQRHDVAAAKATYGPSLTASAGFVEAGTLSAGLVWNWNIGLNLNWQMFQGMLSPALTREATANLDDASAQLLMVRQQVRLDVEQATIAVRSAKASMISAHEVMTNAGLRLRLAEERYQIGIGNVIELADAQSAHAQAASLVVVADYNLGAARAQLVWALGRD